MQTGFIIKYHKWFFLFYINYMLLWFHNIGFVIMVSHHKIDFSMSQILFCDVTKSEWWLMSLNRRYDSFADRRRVNIYLLTDWPTYNGRHLWISEGAIERLISVWLHRERNLFGDSVKAMTTSRWSSLLSSDSQKNNQLTNRPGPLTGQPPRRKRKGNNCDSNSLNNDSRLHVQPCRRRSLRLRLFNVRRHQLRC